MEVGEEAATIGAMARRLSAALFTLLCGFGALFAQDEPAGDGAVEIVGVDPKSLTASELYEQGRQAYSRQEFPLAEVLLLELIASYGQNAELKEAIDKVKPLVALAQLRQKKFEEALPSIEAAIAAGGMPPEVVGELEFWRGLCLMQIGSYVPAQHAFGEFYQKYHGKEGRTRRELMRAHESLLLFAAAYVAKEDKEYGELIAMLNHVMPKLRLESREAAARATVLLMHSLVESERFDEAFELVKVQFQDLEAVTQLIALQSMALEVGSNYLEQGEYYKAIACLQRIWLRDRLLRHQRDRLADLEEKMEILQSRRGMQDFVFQYDGMIRRVKLELEAFEKIEDYDAALRLRLANAFVGLQRYWEAALVLEDMLVNMPRGPIVEQASLSWIQCWMQCSRWDKAVAAADIYLEKFDNSDQDERVPTVLMLKADSYREMPERARAREVYAEVVERFPTGNLAPRALFMQGILYLEDDENDKAITAFNEVRERFGDQGIAEDAHYWKGMASSFAKDYSVAREVLSDYLKAWNEKGRYRIDAAFRSAYCAHASADYDRGIEELGAFLKAHPGSPYESEAEILLGDGLLNEGRMEEGIATYRAIAPEDARFFEEGWFKIGKALRLFATSSTPTEIDEAFVERLIGVRGKFDQWWEDTEKAEMLAQIRKHAVRYGGSLESDIAEPGKAFVEWLKAAELLAKHYEIKAGDEVDLERRRFQQAAYEEWWSRRSRTMWLEVAKKHFDTFAKNYPKSPRLGEAVYWAGWALQQGGDEEGAREIYWKTIEEEGNDPAQASVVSLFQGLEKLYKSKGELLEYDRELGLLARRAQGEEKTTLQLWIHWARATGSNVETSVRESNFGRAVRLADPSIHSPVILADCADFLLAKGDLEEAKELYIDFRKWNPRAIERERAFYGLAATAAAEEDWEEAEYQLLRLRRHGVTNSLVADGRILLAEVQLKKGDKTAARATFEELLKEKFIPARKKCEVLVSLGDLLVELEERKPALAVYERVYIGYGRYPDLVAQSYWKRGSLLEELGMPDKATEVFKEMTGRADLENEPDTEKARERLKELSPEPEEAAA